MDPPGKAQTDMLSHPPACWLAQRPGGCCRATISLGPPWLEEEVLEHPQGFLPANGSCKNLPLLCTVFLSSVNKHPRVIASRIITCVAAGVFAPFRQIQTKMPDPRCKPRGGFAQNTQEPRQQLGSGRSSLAPSDLLGSSRWSGHKSPPKPGKGTNLLEDKSVGEGGKLGVSSSPPSSGKCQQHPACRRKPSTARGLGYLVETWIWDKQTFYLGHSKLSHKCPTQGHTAAGASLEKTTSGEF